MAIFREIDLDGYYLQDVELDENIDPDKYIEVNWTGQSLHEPRWSKTEKVWYEGMDKTELDNMLEIKELKRKIEKARGLIIQSKSYCVSHNKYENMMFDSIVEYKNKIKILRG